MSGVRVSEHYGIVVRKAALQRGEIDLRILLSVMETDRALDEDQDLISFGPHFGGEAAQEFTRRLEALGLSYGDDFLDFAMILPEWCQLYLTVKSSDNG